MHIIFCRARQEQLERQAEIQRKKEEEVQRKLEEKNKSLSSTMSSMSSWRNTDKSKDESKLFGSTRDKDRRDGGFSRARDDGPPSERRSLFSRDDRKSGTLFGSRDNDRGGWNRGGSTSASGSSAFDKSFKDGLREGGRTAFDRDTPRKRDIPTSNDQVN